MIGTSENPYTSIWKCLDKDGNIEMEKWIGRRKAMNAEIEKILDEEVHEEVLKVKKNRARRGFYYEETEEWLEQDPKMSNWWISYIGSYRCSTVKRMKKKFRRRFRMPRDCFLKLLDTAKKGIMVS